MDSGNRNRNELDDSWHGLTGQTEMLAGDMGAIRTATSTAWCRP